jgi:hypothetical protein
VAGKIEAETAKFTCQFRGEVPEVVFDAQTMQQQKRRAFA